MAMRQIDESKPLSAEDRQWLTDWGRFDQIKRIDEANGVDESEPERTIREGDLRSLLQSHGIEPGEDVLDTIKGVLEGTNTSPVAPSNRLGDSAAHVAPNPADEEPQPGPDVEDDGLGNNDWYEDDGVTADDLKDELGERELSKSGNKGELIARLRESDAAGYGR
jgi:hypothetical protein